jgi:hypothetical protein
MNRAQFRHSKHEIRADGLVVAVVCMEIMSLLLGCGLQLHVYKLRREGRAPR